MVSVYATGEGGNGGTSAHGSSAGAGGGGGAFGAEPALGGLTPGTTTLTITIGSGGTGTNTTVTGGSVTVQANAGTNGSGTTAGTGGTAGANTVAFKGGSGANGAGGATQNGSGGGGSAGSTSAGGDATGSTGGSAGTGAAGLAGVAGANGAGTSSIGANGTAPGGGASGGGSGGSLNHAGGTGAPGQVTITWTVVVISPAGYAAAAGVVTTAKHAAASFKGYISAAGAPQPVRVVNQWSGTFAQPASFGTTPPALQSTVVALTPSSSVGGGTGTPSSGNWLFCLTGWNQASLPAATAGDADDIHSFWRPGDVTTSTWAVSTSAGKTRTSVWYTANLARTAGDVYVAPNGIMAGTAVLVIEVAGLGPWDTVTGIATNYAAAATSLNLALSAPSGPAFILAAACGDSTAATQALAPGSPWQVLSTVSASNGSDHTCDTVLTSAFLNTTSGSVSVNATAVSAADLSGVIIGVLASAPSPVPAGQNPAWPYMILEAAFGSGFETPADQMTWTSLNNWANHGSVRRFWNWNDSSGVPYALGQLQSSTGTVTLDNADGALSPSNTASPYYPDVTTGTPVRLRCAVGTMAGTAVNRWYVLARNGIAWPEKRNKILRNYVPLSTSDIWSVVSGSCPSPYRGEIYLDSPYAWWPCDDQPGAGGVLPVTLRNAAPGNSTALSITASPNGVTAQDLYSSGLGGAGGAAGTDLTAISSSANPSVAVYAVAAEAGWMYGDPQSSPSLQASAGGPVTASPGSAAWQQTGAQGNTGAHGWFLSVNDAGFPPLSGGVSVEGWFQYPFLGSAASINNTGTFYNVAAQPYCALTLLELATASAPVAVLQVDTSGHLSLTTYNGGTGTTHAVYSGSDLRCGAWFQVTVTLTSSTWTVYVNGGLTASASGSATVSPSAWTWLLANGDLGSSGGSSLSAIQHGGNVSVSHLAVYPQVLPKYRVLAHYAAAVTGFGQVPAPTGMQVASTENNQPTGFTPDGTEYQGSYGTGLTAYTFSALAVAVAGSYTSGPSARAITAGQGQGTPSAYSAAVWAGWTAVAPLVQVFTSASAATETEAAACLGAGDSFTTGFGAGASGHGVSQVSGGTGASPPSGPSALGDTVAQRIERVLGYGLVTCPSRAIDASANLLVQAALDVGGQQTGANVQNIADSDDGFLYVDNCGTLSYRSRPHLAADTVTWNVGTNVPAGMIPFLADITYSSDPQRIYTDVRLTPYSPDGATLPVVTPANSAAVTAAIRQYGDRPLTSTSYLQDSSKIQAAANWIFTTFGQLERRVESLTIDAASHPAAWVMVLGANVSDIVQVYDASIGAPATTGNYRISKIARSLSFGANSGATEARLVLTLDPLPASYWS